jgi:hypothetical protein
MVAFEISLPEQRKVFYKIINFLMRHIQNCTQTLVFIPALPGWLNGKLVPFPAHHNSSTTWYLSSERMMERFAIF